MGMPRYESHEFKGIEDAAASASKRNMERAKEFLQSLNKKSPSVELEKCSETGGSWKNEYDKLKKEFELYKQWVETETEAQLSGMEMRWSHLQSEAETMKLTLETQNRELTRQNTVLERQVTALREELEETRLVSHEQVKHCTTIKRQLKERCIGLELKVGEKDKVISELALQLTETKSRNERIYRELLLLSDQKEQLIAQRCETRLKYNENLNDFAGQCNAMLDKVASYYGDELQNAVSNYVDVAEQLDMSKELVSGVLEEMKSKEEEFQNAVAALRAKSKISVKMEEVVDSLQKVAQERDSEVQSKAEAQKLLHDVVHTVNELSTRIVEHQRNSFHLCGRILAILGHGESDFLHDFDWHAVKEVDPKNVRNAASDLISGFGREKLKLESVIKAVLEWKTKSEQKMEQLQGRINTLEKSASVEKTKHSEELGKILEKTKKYKKLIQKLRNKLKAAPKDLCPVYEDRQMDNPFQFKKKRNKNRPKYAHSVAGRMNVREEPFERKIIDIPIQCSSSNQSYHQDNRTSAQVSTCSEYKIMLDNADDILRRMDERTSRFVKPSKVRSNSQSCGSSQSQGRKSE